MSDHAGAAWLQEQFDYIPELRGKTLSPLACTVADILGTVYAGLYHIEGIARQDWFNSAGVFIQIPGELATFDASHLAGLVILCHDAAIRFAVSAGRKPWNLEDQESDAARLIYEAIHCEWDEETARELCSSPILDLSFHQRHHGEGSFSQRHPAIEQSIAIWRRAAERKPT